MILSKKTEYYSLKTKVDSIDTTNLVLKTKFEKGGSDFEDKISKIDKKVIPDASSLVKKTDYNTKISEIENNVNDHNHDKYITTPEFNTLATDVLKARLAAQADLIKLDFDSKLKVISDRVTKNKTKYLLVENELKKSKNLMLLILDVKVILKKMVHKII